jgi:hypothetical protein
MTNAIARYLPDATDLIGLGAVLACAFAVHTVGCALAGRQRMGEGGLIYGWAAVSLLFTTLSVVAHLPFTWIALLFAAAAVAAVATLLVRERGLGDASPLRVLLLSLPLLLLVAGMTPTQWDEMTHWLPNARYLMEHDSFPRADLPASPSVMPGYPHGLTLLMYMASRLAGRLIENSGALFNVLLLLSAGLLVVRALRGALARRDETARVKLGLSAPFAEATGWGFAALAAIAVFMLNPTFVQKIVFTSYADVSTGVALGFTAALGWMMLNAIADGETDRIRALAWQMGLAATALLNIKQVNVVLLAATLAGIGLVALRDSRIGLRSLLRQAARILVPPVAIYLLWRIQLSTQATSGEFSVQPVDKWLLHMIPETLALMGLILAKKGAYLALMLAALAFGARGLWRMRDEFDRLALITATLFVGYNAFLLFTYVTGAFGEYGARHALSYWRYNTHLGIVGLVFGAYGVALLWRRYVMQHYRPRLAWLAIALVVVLPPALAYKIRFDLDKRYVYVHRVAGEISRMLGPAERLLVLDAREDGQYQVILLYVMHGSAKIAGNINAFHRPIADSLRRGLNAEPPPTHVWVHDPVPEAEAVLGVPLPAGSSYLLQRRDGGWRIVESWPHPADTR